MNIDTAPTVLAAPGIDAYLHTAQREWMRAGAPSPYFGHQGQSKTQAWQTGPSRQLLRLR